MPMPVCARCAGLYASGALGAAAAGASARRRLALPGAGGTRLLLATAAAPTVATVALEWLGLVQPPNAARAIAALPLGAAAGWIFVRLLLAEAHAPQSLRYHA
jgi:hypothetical protein